MLNLVRVLYLRRQTEYLEVVDGDKVGEEGQDVFYLEQVALVKELHRPADVLLLLDHVARWGHVSLNQPNLIITHFALYKTF